NARAKTSGLLFLADFQPVLQQNDAVFSNQPLKIRANDEKALTFGFRAESHDPFDSGAVIPAAIPDHHFTGGGKVRNKSLHVHLGPSAFGGRGERHHAKDARADAFGEAFDEATLAGRVTSFKNYHHSPAGLLHPSLHSDELDLEFLHLLLVCLPA